MQAFLGGRTAFRIPYTCYFREPGTKLFGHIYIGVLNPIFQYLAAVHSLKASQRLLSFLYTVLQVLLLPHNNPHLSNLQIPSHPAKKLYRNNCALRSIQHQMGSYCTGLQVLLYQVKQQGTISTANVQYLWLLADVRTFFQPIGYPGLALMAKPVRPSDSIISG